MSGAESASGTGGSANACAGSKLPKNAPRNRSDVGWKHGVPVDGDSRKIKCNYCKKVQSGGIYRFKHHLAGTQKDVGPCVSVPEEVRKQMWDIVASLQQNLLKKTKGREGVSSQTDDSEHVGEESPGSKRSRQEDEKSSNPVDLFKRKGTQSTLSSIFKKDLREEACQEIASFFYNNAISFNAANSDEFQKMFELVARHGPGFKPPSYYEIRVKYLKQKVESTKHDIDEHKAHWKKTGCTIMTDGWTDRRRRTILNFLVNSSKGTFFLKSIDASHISKTADKVFEMMDEIVEEIGEENVIQIVTDNAANYKAAGEKLMEKRKRLYWTPCAAHCIDLMLEDFEKKIPIHKETIARGKKITTFIYSRTSLICLLHNFTKEKDLIRPATTRFATSYLTLGCLYENKGASIRMFTSDEWKSTSFSKSKDGKLIENSVIGKEFWSNIVMCLKGAYPLMKVLRLVDSDEKPAMGFIYEAMDQAKEKIQLAFNGVKKSYMPIWKIIDRRWGKQMHRPLHAAGYYLNPQFHYSPGFKADFEVKRGLYDCLERMVGDIEEVSKIDTQLEKFKSRSDFFGSKIAIAGIQTKTPAQWWESYGDQYPEMQKFAIRVLSLTCSSSGCERNWSAFEHVHTKRRNRLKQKTMNDVVYVMTNSKLSKKKRVRSTSEYNIEDLSSYDEWIVEYIDSELEPNVEDSVGHGGGASSSAVNASREDLEIPHFDDDFDEGGNPMDDDSSDDNNGLNLKFKSLDELLA